MKRKKLLSVFVAAALSLSCFTAVPVVSQAAEYTSGDFTYSLDGGCTITGYNGLGGDVIIPEKIDGYDVLAIGRNAFAGNKEITSVVIPNTLLSVGAFAFSNCTAISSIDLGNSIRSLGQGCFNNCDSLTFLEIPASLTASDASVETPFTAFSYGTPPSCDSLRTVTIASGGTKIPDTLFKNCSSLQNVTIPEGITVIGENAFNNCVSIKEIKIPSSVRTIGTWAFVGCSSLKEITLHENIKKVCPGAFNSCASLKDYYDYSMETEYDEGYWDYSANRIFSDTSFLTIHGFEGSNAQKFANRKNITFVPFTEKQMFRLYNKYSGEHFYTSASAEKDNLVSYGWAYEGTAWIAPASSNTPVYRLYNPNSSEHHYTMKSSEKDFLVGVGWKDEGIGWYSDDNQGTPLYRLYNPNAAGQYEAGGHHYTKDVNEKNSLIAAGWRDEGIGWYGK